MEYSLTTKTIKQLFTILWGIVVFIPIVLSLFRSGVDCDAAYYLCMAERITEGYVPYVDLNVGYTPLWFYVVAAVKVIFNIPNGLYWPYLILYYIVSIGTAYFLYRFLRCLNTSRGVSYFGASMFLLIIHWLYGTLLLEVPFLFWGLLACCLAIEWKGKSPWMYILVGLFSSFAFLTKQYGAGFLVLTLYVIIILAKKDYKYILTYLLGYILPVLACLIIWGDSFISSVITNGYGTEAAELAGYDISLSAKLIKILGGLKFYFIYVCPIALVPIIFIRHIWQQNRIQNLIFAYCGIFGFACQFYFSVGHHYMIPLVPFGIIAMSEMLSLKDSRFSKLIKYTCVALMVLIACYKTYYNRVYKLYIKRDIRKEQQIFTNQVKACIDENKTLFVINGGMYYLYFTADILPPNIDKIGYSFGPMGLDQEKCLKQIYSADYVIRYSKDYSFESFFTDSIKTILEEYPIVTQFEDSTSLLHKISK